MFRAYCDAEGTEVLLSDRRITRIVTTDELVVTHFTCWCGHEGHVADRRLTREAVLAGATFRSDPRERPLAPV